MRFRMLKERLRKHRDLSGEDLFEIDQERAYVEEEEVVNEVTESPKISLDQLGMIMSKANELCDLVKEVDPVPERQSKFLSGMQELLKSYKDEQGVQVAKKRKQTSMGDFFAKRPKN